MSRFDLIIRNGQIVTRETVQNADLGIAGETITAIGRGIGGSTLEEVNASGLHVFPGVIDSHVHFNDPGRAEWEGIGSGSRALAAGGGVMFFDMPLNASPPTISVEAFDQKRAKAETDSVTDFALWGGMVPGNLDQLAPLWKRGVIGFKAFMCESGIEDFPRVDEQVLREGMKRAADLGAVVGVHAESEEITRRLTAELRRKRRTRARDFLDSRPMKAETEAVARAVELAHETGCHLHVVHVSCGPALDVIRQAKKAGTNVTCETCPHYLVLTEDDFLSVGAAAKCAPPLRSRSEQAALWEGIREETVTTIGSDHSPCPPAMKAGADAFTAWGGISGAQHTLSLLLTAGPEREVALTRLARLFSENLVRVFRLPGKKGGLREGNDADLCLVDLGTTFEVSREDLLDRHRQSPYIGRKLTGKVRQTILRGRTIFKDGKIIGQPAGRLIKPASDKHE